ncbi:MAG: RES family NAD+ phosphorylase [Mycobacterium sp.]
MSKSRQSPAIGRPHEDLSDFPRWRLRPSYSLRRAHRHGVSPWWFSTDLSGRFDLVRPHGTCYLAVDPDTALRERFGHELVEQGVITFEAASTTQVSALHVPTGRWPANTCHSDAAQFGMTREVGTCPDYGVPQAWSAAFHRDGYGGVRYQTRFTTGSRPNAVALFDIAGERDWDRDPAPVDGIEACTEAGLRVVRRPTRREVRIVELADN